MPEIEQLLCLVEDILGKFGFSQFEVNLSTRPEASIGSDEVWHNAEGALRNALNSKGWEFTVDEGGGAFYGPKIDIKIQVCASSLRSKAYIIAPTHIEPCALFTTPVEKAGPALSGRP